MCAQRLVCLCRSRYSSFRKAVTVPVTGSTGLKTVRRRAIRSRVLVLQRSRYTISEIIKWNQNICRLALSKLLLNGLVDLAAAVSLALEILPLHGRGRPSLPRLRSRPRFVPSCTGGANAVGNMRQERTMRGREEAALKNAGTKAGFAARTGNIAFKIDGSATRPS